jgi:hypothetical protein
MMYVSYVMHLSTEELWIETEGRHSGTVQWYSSTVPKLILFAFSCKRTVSGFSDTDFHLFICYFYKKPFLYIIIII